LARFGFLPRYGFPAGIVEFDIYNSSYYAQQKKKKRNTPKPKKSEAREDNLSFANGKPMRDLAVALREYAPGNEVAVDGLIYRSAGLELSHFMNKSNANEAQVVRHFAQCRHCGAIDYDVQIDYSTDDDSEAQKVNRQL
jgi:DEAD/DEAH box helicase domain-containing protein